MSNDERKNSLGIIFILFFVMVYLQWAFPSAPPSQQNVTTTQTSTSSPQVAQSSVVASTATGSVQKVPATHPSAQQLSESPQTVINTGSSIITVNHLGARLQNVKLKNYKERLGDSTPLELISTNDGQPLPLGVTADTTNDDFVLYTLDATSLPAMNGPMYVIKDAPVNFVFTGELSTGTKIKKVLTFTPGSYAIQVSVELSEASRDGLPASIAWSQYTAASDLQYVGMQKRVSFLNQEGKLTTTLIKDVKSFTDEGPGKWIVFCDFYFLEGLLSSSEKSAGSFTVENEGYLIKLIGDAKGGNFIAYAGPKDIETLQNVGHGLEKSVDLGIFSVLAHPILALVKFFYKFLGNYGLCIILLTLLIKLAFLPLTQTSFKSMQAMQEIQPEVQALRERIEDQTVLNQELMALYKKRGVNPLGGCLPVVIQIPVFLGLYNALLNSIELRHEPFALWIKDLSAPEQLHLFGINVPLMILIMGASMFVQQLTQPSAMDPQQKKIMMFMPVIFTGMFILHPMPSGLVLYWLVNNVISIVQQKAIRNIKGINPIAITAYASLGIFLFGFVLTRL